MTTINDICTKLNNLAAECGGNHRTGKEVEAILNNISNDLEELAEQLVDSAKNVQDLTGISDNHYWLIKRHKNIKESTLKEGDTE